MRPPRHDFVTFFSIQFNIHFHQECIFMYFVSSTRRQSFGALNACAFSLILLAAPGFAPSAFAADSPKWNFDDGTFERSASAFENPDHVAIVIDNYRWRLSLSRGEPQFDALEKRLAAAPVITVPTITLEGDANGAPHPDPAAYAKKFVGKYAHRTIAGGIGHNLPQEAPKAFADAVIEVASY
jgi:pimeloyl-ACP methyl ester carboxylesterase